VTTIAAPKSRAPHDDAIKLARKAVAAAMPTDSLKAIAALRKRLDALEMQHVDAALARGCTWRDIAEAMGVSRQAAHRKHTARLAAAAAAVEEQSLAGRRLVILGPARAAVALARQEAAYVNSRLVGTEHLLVGLVRQREGHTAAALANLGLTLDKVRHCAQASAVRAATPRPTTSARPAGPPARARRSRVARAPRSSRRCTRPSTSATSTSASSTSCLPCCATTARARCSASSAWGSAPRPSRPSFARCGLRPHHARRQVGRRCPRLAREARRSYRDEMAAVRNMTAQELLQYSHEPFTGFAGAGRTELIAGRLIEMEPAGGVHGVVAAQICGLLTLHVLPRGLGKVFGAETGYLLARDPDTVRAPDASFLSWERIDAMGGIPAGYLPGAPDLAFEVVSPGDRTAEVESKTRTWLAAGAKAVVVVEPRQRTAAVHRPDASTRTHGGSDTLGLDDVLAGFNPTLAAIFD